MEKLLTCVMDIGEQMLLSGAEVNRVEESLRRMCTAFGAMRTDVFIITSSMVVTIYLPDKTWLTQTRRITGSANDFEKLHRLNALSRKICSSSMTADQIRAELQEVLRGKAYPLWLEYLCYAVIAGAFTLFFGGTVTDMLISLSVGAIVRLGMQLTERVITNRIFSRFFSSALATAFAFLAVRLHWAETADKIIIGNIMTLIPGIGLTTAIRDLFTGDSIAGLLRSIEAVLTALSIAAGYFLIALLGGISA